MGNKSFPKEHMDIFADGKVISLDDYRTLTVVGSNEEGWRAATAIKGQYEELQTLSDVLAGKSSWPISLQSQMRTSRAALEIEKLITR
jgi:hypothetical protein